VRGIGCRRVCNWRMAGWVSVVASSAALALALVAALPAAAQVNELLATGRAPVRNGDTLAARDAAVLDARRRLIDRGVLELGGPDLLEQGRSAIPDEIYPRDSRYVANLSVTAEGVEGDSYRVSIRASVDLSALRHDLEAAGIARRGARHRPRVMVLIDEYFGADEAPQAGSTLSREVTVESSKHHEAASGAVKESASVAASGSASSDVRAKGAGGAVAGRESATAAVAGSASRAASAAYVNDDAHFALSIREYFPDAAQAALPESSAAAEISARLLKDDFNLVDRSLVAKLREEELGRDGYMVEFLRSGARVAQAARAASQKYGAELLLVGACRVVHRGTGDDGQHVSGASLVLKVVNASTGQLVAAVSDSEPGMSGDAPSSRVVAAKRVGAVVGDNLAGQLLEQARNRERAGIEVEVALYGVPDLPTKLAFTAFLEGLDGVQAVEERTYDRANARVEYQVTFRGSVTQLKNGLLKKALAEPRWRRLDEQLSQGNKVSLVLKGSR